MIVDSYKYNYSKPTGVRSGETLSDVYETPPDKIIMT